MAFVVLACVLASVCPSSLVAGQQSSQQSNGRLKVYLDCNNCDGDFIRDEVDIVEYVRDPAEADVHVIVTSSETGSGGLERSVALLGLGRFKGMDFKLRALSERSTRTHSGRPRDPITMGILNILRATV